MYVSIIVIALLTGLYTVIGGLRAVVVTESIQTIVLLTGAIIITAICYNKAGGWHGITNVLHTTGRMDKVSMLRPMVPVLSHLCLCLHHFFHFA